MYSLSEMLMTFKMESGSDDTNMEVTMTATNKHIKIMWEANCSCRAAGYPEASSGELRTTLGDGGSTCSGLPSPMDVPTASQAATRESAAEVLQLLRQLAGLVWPDHPAETAASCSNGIGPASYADWEVLQSELLELPSPSQSEGLPAASSSEPCSWGEALWCFNPACTNLDGPSELALKTLACGGGCGVRYCSPAGGCRIGGRFDSLAGSSREGAGY